MARMLSLCLTLLILATLCPSYTAVKYEVTDAAKSTPGGIRFKNEIGLHYTKQTLMSSAEFIWRLFQQNNESERKGITKVHLFIESMEGIAYTLDNEIHLSANYTEIYSGDVRTEISGILYHEMTHVWQWDGKGHAPQGLIEGIADFVRLRAYYAPSHWVQPGAGERWDQGYDVTARFLDYCTCLRNEFVAELNAKMRDGYSDRYFVSLLGKTVNQLWIEYKTKYAD